MLLGVLCGRRAVSVGPLLAPAVTGVRDALGHGHIAPWGVRWSEHTRDVRGFRVPRRPRDCVKLLTLGGDLYGSWGALPRIVQSECAQAPPLYVGHARVLTVVRVHCFTMV